MNRNGEVSADFRCGYVALVGAPNAGKSTLLNRLVDHKLAITSPKPQTTRRRTLGIVHTDSYQIILLDTPGIISPRYALQTAMMRTVSQVLSDVDVACFLIDAGEASPDRVEIPGELRSFGGRRIAVANKIDKLRSKEAMIPLLQGLGDTGLFDEIIPISALRGEGVDLLLQSLVEKLPTAPPYYPPDQLTEHPERFFVAELIRETIYRRFAQEIPYAVEVEIVQFIERTDAKDYVEAALFVEQASQKSILIGRKGQAIRALGEDARGAIEEFLGREVFLELRVKVAPKWRKSEATLRRFGYRS